MKTRFTPGPWKLRTTELSVPYKGEIDTVSTARPHQWAALAQVIIASADGETDGSFAAGLYNGYLIAKAPELYEALYETVQLLTELRKRAVQQSFDLVLAGERTLHEHNAFVDTSGSEIFPALKKSVQVLAAARGEEDDMA